MTGFSALNSDLLIDTKGNLITTSGNDEIIENCYHEVLLILGEYEYNTEIGIPWNDYLSSVVPVGNLIKSSLTNAVLLVDGVTAVRSVDIVGNREKRRLEITMEIVINGGTSEVITLNKQA